MARKSNSKQTPEIIVGEPELRKKSYFSSIIIVTILLTLFGLFPYFLWSSGKNKDEQNSFTEQRYPLI